MSYLAGIGCATISGPHTAPLCEARVRPAPESTCVPPLQVAVFAGRLGTAVILVLQPASFGSIAPGWAGRDQQLAAMWCLWLLLI